jgi:hypothetical protein
MSAQEKKDVTDYELDEIQKRIGALNLDWTNRKEKVRTQQSLAIGVRESLISLGSPEIVSFSEVSGKEWIKKFERDTGHTGSLVKGQYGYMYISWNKEDIVHLESIESLGRRYTGVLLYNVKTKKRHLHLGVHMPTKSGKAGWRANANAISKCVRDYQESKEGVDFVSISGDFNADPTKVVEHFSPDGLHFAVTSNKKSTTEAGNCIDNVISSIEFENNSITIDEKNDRFTHHPIAATTK